VLFTECVKRLGAIASSLFMAFVPACTAALAWWLLGEALSPWQLAGIALCSAALLYYTASASPRLTSSVVLVERGTSRHQR
jgi:drug/metabolite transporter (DMT)-like permease